jgi:hypothetical protein
VWTSIVTRLDSSIDSAVRLTTIWASIGVPSMSAATYCISTRAWRRSAARSITMPFSPGDSTAE